jgi:hypothetical protein
MSAAVAASLLRAARTGTAAGSTRNSTSRAHGYVTIWKDAAVPLITWAMSRCSVSDDTHIATVSYFASVRLNGGEACSRAIGVSFAWLPKRGAS